MGQGKSCESLQYHEPSNAQRNHTANTDNHQMMQWSAINEWTHGAQLNWGPLKKTLSHWAHRELWKGAIHLLILPACLHLRFHIGYARFYCLSRGWDRTREHNLGEMFSDYKRLLVEIWKSYLSIIDKNPWFIKTSIPQICLDWPRCF